MSRRRTRVDTKPIVQNTGRSANFTSDSSFKSKLITAALPAALELQFHAAKRLLDPNAVRRRHWLSKCQQLSDGLLRLTPGQLEVLKEFLFDPNDRVIARKLGLCESTVRNHLCSIEARLNVDSRSELLGICLAILLNTGVGLPLVQRTRESTPRHVE